MVTIPGLARHSQITRQFLLAFPLGTYDRQSVFLQEYRAEFLGYLQDLLALREKTGNKYLMPHTIFPHFSIVVINGLVSLIDPIDIFIHLRDRNDYRRVI
jgi:hypothetical protein